MKDLSPTRPKFITYYRVSTDKQGRSGLGLDAQIAAAQQYKQRSGGEIIETFKEVETGKRNHRPELLKALALCRQKKAILIIAKLDRLSRNLAFIANLIESNVEFVACDMPEADKTMLQIMAVFAEHESDAISKRTKEALAAAKARGQKLGSPRHGSRQATAARKVQAAQFREGVYPIARQLKDRGLTLRQIAQELNERHIRTCNNRAWYPMTVSRLLHDQGKEIL
jgi:DNA invertase Pin-like site-specific DNA recombinase